MTCTLIFADLLIGNLVMGKFSLENATFLQWACKYRLGNAFLIHWAALSPILDQFSDIAKWNFVTPCFETYEQQTGAMISGLFQTYLPCIFLWFFIFCVQNETFCGIHFCSAEYLSICLYYKSTIISACNTETYLEPCQKPPSWIFDTVLKLPL